ncbi:hypothetical protein [Alkalilimnicola sp. S0819]|uniref:hypothetical protein n=1 Tax=Alkalilimnicola sp. S0819 TaxID=2613922 RepID=UPI001262AB04|nr:hypothetical protein [Alkalilimnicola sp. S0819]KAB7622853.1 SGNH/GDSL hydrolase family protein [Alkalilimnicola sp. S0819]MPQ17175.1 hypothetical protein [Alkalilimnicola sp. S0819]
MRRPGGVVVASLWFCIALIAGGAMAEQRIVYIEASTVHRWKLEQLPERMALENVSIRVHRIHGFDKSAAVAAVLGSGERPDLVVLQQCSVYFPGELGDYRRKTLSWLEQLEGQGITVALATTVPTAASLGWWQDFKNLVKTRLLGREGQQEQITNFNTWLRQLAAQRRLPLFDPEAALRQAEPPGYLDPAYDAGDGIHLNARGYERLDRVFYRFLQGLGAPRACEGADRTCA